MNPVIYVWVTIERLSGSRRQPDLQREVEYGEIVEKMKKLDGKFKIRK
jgi:hypothetical protein